jgi:rhodanese-related sulfurtransferase
MSMQLLTAQQAYEMVLAGEAYGVDVREQFEWDAGHFDQFTLNPLSTFDLAAIPTDKPIIFVCRSGNRSGQVCDALAEIRPDVYNLAGGMKSWLAAGLPMTSVTGSPEVA